MPNVPEVATPRLSALVELRALRLRYRKNSTRGCQTSLWVYIFNFNAGDGKNISLVQYMHLRKTQQ